MRYARIKSICLVSAFSALALVFSLLENFFPPLYAAVPYAKLGLANIITILGICLIGGRRTLCVVILRVLLGALFLGNVFSLVYSAPAGLASFFISWLLIKCAVKILGYTGVSVIAAITHNIVQTLMASLINGNFYLFYSAAYLILISTGAGIFIGLTAGYALKKIKEINPIVSF